LKFCRVKKQCKNKTVAIEPAAGLNTRNKEAFMQKILVLFALTVVFSGCAATRSIREVRIQKDAEGKVTGTEYVERQEQCGFARRFDLKTLNNN
jgi:uncharacterized protein YceK